MSIVDVVVWPDEVDKHVITVAQDIDAVFLDVSKFLEYISVVGYGKIRDNGGYFEA